MATQAQPSKTTIETYKYVDKSIHFNVQKLIHSIPHYIN